MKRVAALVLTAALLLGAPALGGSAWSQDGQPDSGVELPDPHIIPRSNSGKAPEEAGDRGGALQLAVLGLVVVAIGGGIAMVVRESRRARAGQ